MTTTTTTTTFEQLKAILLDHLEIEESAITMEASITGDLHADSLDFMDILMDLEEIFDIEIPEKSTGDRVKDIIAYIEQPVAAKPAKKEKLKKSA